MDNSQPEIEPVAKKQKMIENSHNKITEIIDGYISKLNETTTLKAVLSDEYYKPSPLRKVYVGHVKEKKDLSRIIAILNEKLPLNTLQHLKRVVKGSVILCPLEDLDNSYSIQEYLEQKVPELMNGIFNYFTEKDLPAVAPKIKGQYNPSLWACNFHPDKYLEKLVSDKFFSENEVKAHVSFMSIALETLRWHLQDTECDLNSILDINNATVVVDPKENSVVAVSFCNNDHPTQHSAMLAIDNVAKTQSGGVWGEKGTEKHHITRGINEGLKDYLVKKFPETKFFARQYLSKSDMKDYEEKYRVSMSEVLKDTPYLCTGYYVYILREPCVMCAMALVHARAKRIFFCKSNLQHGALNSCVKLQTVTALNHHFEVFSGFAIQ